jgi:hypothetical protein
VIEFGNGTNRLPRTGRVAVLARDIQVAVGAVRPGGLPVRVRQRPGKQEQKNETQVSYGPKPCHDVPLARVPNIATKS